MRFHRDRRPLLLPLTVCLLGGCSDGASNSTPADSTPAAETTDPRDGGAGDGSAIVDSAPGDDAASPITGACPVTGDVTCGGDLLGLWNLVDMCPEDPAAAKALFEHPFDDREACADRAENPVDGRFETTGTILFEQEQLTIETTGKIDVSYGFTDECLAVAVGGVPPAEACASMTRPDRMSCEYDADATPPCSCSASLPADPIDETGPYSRISETTIALDEGRRATYCVDGDTVILDWFSFHPVSWRYWVLQR